MADPYDFRLGYDYGRRGDVRYTGQTAVQDSPIAYAPTPPAEPMPAQAGNRRPLIQGYAGANMPMAPQMEWQAPLPFREWFKTNLHDGNNDRQWDMQVLQRMYGDYLVSHDKQQQAQMRGGRGGLTPYQEAMIGAAAGRYDQSERHFSYQQGRDIIKDREGDAKDALELSQYFGNKAEKLTEHKTPDDLDPFNREEYQRFRDRESEYLNRWQQLSGYSAPAQVEQRYQPTQAASPATSSFTVPTARRVRIRFTSGPNEGRSGTMPEEALRELEAGTYEVIGQ